MDIIFYLSILGHAEQPLNLSLLMCLGPLLPTINNCIHNQTAPNSTHSRDSYQNRTKVIKPPSNMDYVLNPLTRYKSD